MPLLTLSYFCLGAAIAVGMMLVPSLSLRIRTVACRMGIQLHYARSLWIIGTIVAWPVGLYVLLTGRLVLPTKGLALMTDPSISILRRSREEANRLHGRLI